MHMYRPVTVVGICSGWTDLKTFSSLLWFFFLTKTKKSSTSNANDESIWNVWAHEDKTFALFSETLEKTWKLVSVFYVVLISIFMWNMLSLLERKTDQNSCEIGWIHHFHQLTSKISSNRCRGSYAQCFMLIATNTFRLFFGAEVYVPFHIWHSQCAIKVKTCTLFANQTVTIRTYCDERMDAVHGERARSGKR